MRWGKLGAENGVTGLCSAEGGGAGLGWLAGGGHGGQNENAEQKSVVRVALVYSSPGKHQAPPSFRPPVKMI